MKSLAIKISLVLGLVWIPLPAFATNIDTRNEFGETPLMQAAYECGHCGCISDSKEVQRFLNQGANPNVRNHNGETALMEVARDGWWIDTMRVLLRGGAKVNLRNHNGETALMLAVDEAGNLDPKSARGEGINSLFNSTSTTIKMLLNNGSRINARDNIGHGALWRAQRNGSAFLVKWLRGSGARGKPMRSRTWPTIDNISTDYEYSRKYESEKIRIIQLLLRSRGYKLAVDSHGGIQTADRLKRYGKQTGAFSTTAINANLWESLVSRAHYGNRGDAVRAIQILLNKHHAKIAVDGIFGRRTRLAVKKFQRKNGLLADGVVGLYTWSALLDGKVGTKLL